MLSVPEQKAFRIACWLWPLFALVGIIPAQSTRYIRQSAICFARRLVPTSYVPAPHPEYLIVELNVAVYSKFGTLITHKCAQVPGDAGKRFLQCDENHGRKYRVPQH